jgi:hypothetical protein
VEHPLEPEKVLCTLLVEPGAVSSSSTTERRFFRRGKEYGHVLDPRTGRPARGVRSVTLWTETALLGDVLSTAAYVLGRDALSPGGPVETLAQRWHEGEDEPRVSVLLIEENPRLWGGIETIVRHFGHPAFEVEEP